MRTGQRTTMNADQQRQQAINEHRCIPGDAFVYGVVTTGIFCLPTCPSRRPRSENVRLFDNARAALQSGYRPCRRCHPLGDSPSPIVTTVIALCRTIDTAEHKPTLAELSVQSGWSPSHLQRQFKAITGISPHQYGVAHRVAEDQQGGAAHLRVDDHQHGVRHRMATASPGAGSRASPARGPRGL